MLENDEYKVDQPDLPDVPQDEQQHYAPAQPFAWLPTLLVLGGASMLAAAILSWKYMGIDFPYEGWTRFLPGITFVSALLGVVLIFSGVYLTLLEPQPPPTGDRFAAWGRFAFGVAFTFVGMMAKHRITYTKNIPPEAAAFGVMCLIVGPVLCGWACYGTFVKDRSQRNTGILMILALASFLAVVLWG